MSSCFLFCLFFASYLLRWLASGHSHTFNNTLCAKALTLFCSSSVWTTISWETVHCRIKRLSSCSVLSPQAFHIVNMELREYFACFKVSVNAIFSICGKPQFEVLIPERALCLFGPRSLFGLCKHSLPLTAHYERNRLILFEMCFFTKKSE